jgi:hypothetical protein
VKLEVLEAYQKWVKSLNLLGKGEFMPNSLFWGLKVGNYIYKKERS